MEDSNTGSSESTSETSDEQFLAEDTKTESVEDTSFQDTTGKDNKEISEEDSDLGDSEDSEDEIKASEEVDLTEEEKEIEAKITRPSWEKLKEKYPDVVKDRELREIYFRDQQFSELFPSLEEARNASERARLFEYFDGNIATGDPKVLLEALEPRVLERFSENILDSLYSHDQKLFIRATAPYLSNVLNSIHESAEVKGDKNLVTSVMNLCKYLYGDFKLPSRPVNRNHPELESEKRALRQEREKLFEVQRGDFTAKSEKIIGSRLDKILREDLGVKNEYLANSIIKDTIDRLKTTLEQDESFISSMRNIFIQASKSNYSAESQARVISAYLGRAKGIALKLRAEVKAAALGKPSNEKPVDTKRVEGKNKGSDKSQKGEDNPKDLKNTGKFSDLDILNMP